MKFYEDLIDHCSYANNLSSSEIKAFFVQRFLKNVLRASLEGRYIFYSYNSPEDFQKTLEMRITKRYAKLAIVYVLPNSQS